jgi:hypothetical protein
VIALVNAPVPVPSVVFELLVVGFAVVLQHTPRAVTVELPALVTLPPLVAPLAVIDVAEVLVTVGAVPPPPLVVNVICVPYAVPALFVA